MRIAVASIGTQVMDSAFLREFQKIKHSRNAKGVDGDSIYYKAANRDKSQGVWEKE